MRIMTVMIRKKKRKKKNKKNNNMDKKTKQQQVEVCHDYGVESNSELEFAPLLLLAIKKSQAHTSLGSSSQTVA